MPQNHRLHRCERRLTILVWGFLGVATAWSPPSLAHADTTPGPDEQELADDEVAKSTFVTDVGLEGVYYFRDRGPRLVARPDHPDTPLSIQIVRAEAQGEVFLYELRYVAQFAGEFDLRYDLMRPDQRSPTELRPMHILVRAILPPDFEGALETMEESHASRAARHALLLVVIGTLWMIPPFWALLRRVTRKPAEVAVPQENHVQVSSSREPLQIVEAPWRMARFLLVLWLMVPWGVVAWYVGPGRVHLSEDRAGAYLRDADRLAAMEQWHDAALAYGVARDALAENAVYKRTQLRYAEAVARMKGGEQAAGRRQINQLLVDIERLQVEAVGDAEDTWELSLQVRNAIASSAYYAAWRLRLERAATKEWKSRLETAQQQFRKLVEQTDRRVKDSAAQRHSAVRRQSRMFRRNLEAAVLLGQVDLTQLAAWPLPEEFPEREHVLERKRIIEQELPLRSTLSLEE